MPRSLRLLYALFASAVIISGCVPLRETQDENIRDFYQSIEKAEVPFTVPPGTRVDTVIVDHRGKNVTVRLNDRFSYQAYRTADVRRVYAGVETFFERGFKDYTFSIETLGFPLEQLVPNYYRNSRAEYDRERLPPAGLLRPAPVVTNMSKGNNPQNGLLNMNIGLWHSHGWYYNNKRGRWEWQRPRLFQSVEDLGPMSFTIPYLIPMLENAGANVFLPRERDTQTGMALVDNDSSAGFYREAYNDSTRAWTTAMTPAFARGNPPYHSGENPFRSGTHRVARSDVVPSATATWVPDIPADGDYAVYVSYGETENNVSDARYTVYHRGGRTVFRVNQQIGHATWQFLGRFGFRRGVNPDSGRVVLSNESARPGGTVSADASRFGGGMGLVARNGTTSGRARYLEGARYHLQYAGIPDTLVYNLHADSNDYRDDYQSRAEYLNYLTGAPYGPNRNRMVEGLGIPIDISLAFHTDAGVTDNDTTVGTLAIYSVEGRDSARVFPDSTSRLANRDLADLVQTQIVEDLRALYDPAWNRRALMNADYSEATRPNMPSVLLELLSHQNFSDMLFMLDPRFRFDVARAIYKSMLRFLSVQHNRPFVVQPLPPTHFATELTGGGRVRLQWRPRPDPLEPTARATHYVVYTRVDDGGFDNGRVVADTAVEFPGLVPDRIYSYRVVAANAGGESFPSEILSVCRMENEKPVVLIVNGFTRVSGPLSIQAPEFTGFLDFLDAGVPDRYTLNFTGDQHDFNPASRFRLNDAPGHGASFADHEGTIIAGNTFDFPAVHGRALRLAGHSFSSCSKAAVMDTMVRLSNYGCVDLLLGEEKETRWQRPVMDSLRGKQFRAFPAPLQAQIRSYCEAGGNMLISGAYVGTDPFARLTTDTTDAEFVSQVLKYTWVTDHAARTGKVISAPRGGLTDTLSLRFNTELSPGLYQVESPDAINPMEGAVTLLLYEENLFSAATAFKGGYSVVVLGFPFECIQGEGDKALLMKEILGFFGI
ncbi:MAG: fibronectin type III domain-containing protein [Bacteroidota bacterium]